MARVSRPHSECRCNKLRRLASHAGEVGQDVRGIAGLVAHEVDNRDDNPDRHDDPAQCGGIDAAGEVKVLKLPNSQLEVQYPVKFFRLIQDSDPPSLNPDISATLSFADFLAGRDPALDVALGRSQGASAGN